MEFEINGKTYKSAPLTFNTVCVLESYGISPDKMTEMQLSTLRAYLSVCSGKNTTYAGKEIEAHIINGGTLEDLATAFSKEIDESDFFQALKAKTEKQEEAKGEKTSS